jgi:hypothetical protein
MNSTAFFAMADLLLQPAVVAGVLFFHWWTIWFVLGRNFSTTTLMLLVSRVLTSGALWVVLASGAVGSGAEAAREFSASENITAALMLLALFYYSDILTLKVIMRRVRNGFTWKRHDLISFAVANCVYLAGALLLAR